MKNRKALLLRLFLFSCVFLVSLSFAFAAEVDFGAYVDSDQDGVIDAGSVTVGDTFDLIILVDVDTLSPVNQLEFTLTPDPGATVIGASSGPILADATPYYDTDVAEGGWKYGEACALCQEFGENLHFVTLTLTADSVGEVDFTFTGLLAKSGAFVRTTTIVNPSPVSIEAAGPFDTTAPIVEIIPMDGSVEIHESVQGVFTFSEEVQMVGGVSLESALGDVVLLEKAAVRGVYLPYTFDYNPLVYEGTIVPDAPLLEGEVYIITVLGDSVEDMAGNLLAETTSTFTVMEAADTIAPVLSYVPEQGASDVPVDTVLTVSANEPVVASAPLEDVFSLYDLSLLDFVDVRISFDGVDTFQILQISGDFSYGTHYSLIIEAALIEDLAGNVVSTFSNPIVQFSTESAPSVDFGSFATLTDCSAAFGIWYGEHCYDPLLVDVDGSGSVDVTDASTFSSVILAGAFGQGHAVLDSVSPIGDGASLDFDNDGVLGWEDIKTFTYLYFNQPSS